MHYASCALRSIENRKPNPTSPSRNYLREQNARRVCQGKRRDFRRLISVIRANRSLDSVQAYYILESSFSTPSFSLEFVITTREPRNRNLTQDIYIYIAKRADEKERFTPSTKRRKMGWIKFTDFLHTPQPGMPRATSRRGDRLPWNTALLISLFFWIIYLFENGKMRLHFDTWVGEWCRFNDARFIWIL